MDIRILVTQIIVAVGISQANSQLEGLPAGHLFAQLLEFCPGLTSDQLETVLQHLEEQGLLTKQHHLLKLTPKGLGMSARLMTVWNAADEERKTL